MTDNELSLEPLAERLHFKMEHLDPCMGDWETLTEDDKDFFRQCIEYVVLDRELLLHCVSLRFPHYRGVDGSSNRQ